MHRYRNARGSEFRPRGRRVRTRYPLLAAVAAVGVLVPLAGMSPDATTLSSWHGTVRAEAVRAEAVRAEAAQYLRRAVEARAVEAAAPGPRSGAAPGAPVEEPPATTAPAPNAAVPDGAAPGSAAGTDPPVDVTGGPAPVTPSAAAADPVTAAATAGAAAAPVLATAAATTSGTGAPLSWAPPAGYTGYRVAPVTATDSLTVLDGRGGDLLVQLSPTHPVGPITIANCRNAVLIGGAIRVLPSAKVGGHDQRAIYVRGCTGVVHIEGVHIDGNVAGAQSDGIAVNAPHATVQIQNVRVEGLRGAHSGNHADVFQPWGGVKEFRIDRLSGSSNYQGLHIFENRGPIGRGTVRNTHIAGTDVLPVDRGGYFIWTDCDDRYPLALEDVHVTPRGTRPFGQSVWPPVTASSCPAVVRSGMATWPGNPNVTGGVREGAPAAGDFVPAGSVGLGYASPGYR